MKGTHCYTNDEFTGVTARPHTVNWNNPIRSQLAPPFNSLIHHHEAAGQWQRTQWICQQHVTKKVLQNSDYHKCHWVATPSRCGVETTWEMQTCKIWL